MKRFEVSESLEYNLVINNLTRALHPQGLAVGEGYIIDSYFYWVIIIVDHVIDGAINSINNLSF